MNGDNRSQHEANGVAERVARVETAIEHIMEDIREIRAEMREMRADMRAMRDEITKIRTTDFRWLVGLFLALGGLMAHGFGWF